MTEQITIVGIRFLAAAADDESGAEGNEDDASATDNYSEDG